MAEFLDMKNPNKVNFVTTATTFLARCGHFHILKQRIPGYFILEL